MVKLKHRLKQKEVYEKSLYRNDGMSDEQIGHRKNARNA